MNVTPEDISPVASTTNPSAVSNSDSGDIPDEVLQLPIMTGLLQGKPAAVSSPEGVKDPDIDLVLKNAKPLMSAGFGFYRSKTEMVNVLFNGAYITGEELRKADDEGKLEEVAPPFKDVKASFANATAAAPPQQSAPPPSSPPLNRKLATARVNAVKPGAPTSGSMPGQGRILNSIVKPVV